MPIAARVLVILAAAASTTVAGQDIAAIDAIGGPFTGPPVFNAPFSADATTTLTQSSGTVTGSTRNGKARYYRDSAGRVRVQQTVEGVNGRVTIIAFTGTEARDSRADIGSGDRRAGVSIDEYPSWRAFAGSIRRAG